MDIRQVNVKRDSGGMKGDMQILNVEAKIQRTHTGRNALILETISSPCGILSHT